MKDQCTSTEQDSLVYVGKLPRLTGLCGEVARDYQKVWLSTGLVISE